MLQIPEPVRRYFESRGIDQDPIITAEFIPERGWKYTGYKKRVSRSWCRKLRKYGVTDVQLTAGGRHADFTIKEILSTRKMEAR